MRTGRRRKPLKSGDGASFAKPNPSIPRRCPFSRMWRWPETNCVHHRTLTVCQRSKTAGTVDPRLQDRRRDNLTNRNDLHRPRSRSNRGGSAGVLQKNVRRCPSAQRDQIPIAQDPAPTRHHRHRLPEMSASLAYPSTKQIQFAGQSLTPERAIFPTTDSNYRQSMPDASIKPAQLSITPMLSTMIVSACRKRRSTGRRSLDIFSTRATDSIIPRTLPSPL